MSKSDSVDPNENDTDSGESESESDYATPPFSPLTSEDDSLSSDSNSDEEKSELPSASTEATITAGAKTSQTDHTSNSGVKVNTLQSCVSNALASYKLCGDNIDKTVRQRYMRVDSRGTLSLHYFHFYGVLGRVTFNHLSPLPPSNISVDPQKAMKILLPSTADDEKLSENFITLISRILVNEIDIFKFSFSDIVEWHISHKYSKEMSQKSKVVSANSYLVKQYYML